MDPDDWTLAGLIGGYGMLGATALFLGYYHKRHIAAHFRANVFFLALATLGLVRCLFFGLSIYYSASRSSRDFLDDIPGILFFSACCLFLYRLKPTATPRRWRRVMKYIRLLSNFYVLATVNILFYLFYFVLLYLTFTYQERTNDDDPDEMEENGNVLILETCISALFAAGYLFLVVSTLCLSLPFFYGFAQESNGHREYTDIADPGEVDTKTTDEKRKLTKKQNPPSSLYNSESDLSTATDSAYSSGTVSIPGLPHPTCEDANFIDVHFSADSDSGWRTHSGHAGLLPPKRRTTRTGSFHSNLEEPLANNDSVVDIESDRIVKPGSLEEKTDDNHSDGSKQTLSCFRKSLLMTFVWLTICCFAARVTFLILSTFFETPDQYNLHYEHEDGREAAKVVTRFMYYFIGEMLPSLMLLVLHIHVITHVNIAKILVPETTEKALLLSTAGSGSTKGTLIAELVERVSFANLEWQHAEFVALVQEAGIPKLQEDELVMGELIGCGSFGVVHRAQWRGLAVAVKRLYLPAHMQQDDAVLSFMKEIVLINQLRHPNIVQFLGYTSHPLMLVTEFMPLGSLTEVLRNPVIKDQLDHGRRLRMARDIALGMSYLHGASILHRDLCPSNCLVDANLVVKIADFGLARLKSLGRTMTRGLGTPALLIPDQYMAPEVLKNGPSSEKSDVYSFAVCLWQLCTDEEPYGTMEGAYQVVYAVTNGTRPPLNHDALDECVRELLKRCWAEDPRQRPSFKAILHRLNRMLLEEENSHEDLWRRSNDDQDYGDDDDDDDDGERNDGNRLLMHSR